MNKNLQTAGIIVKLPNGDFDLTRDTRLIMKPDRMIAQKLAQISRAQTNKTNCVKMEQNNFVQSLFV